MTIRIRPEEETLLRALRRLPAGDRGIVMSLVGPSPAPTRTFATLKDRKAGKGFSCPCGRNDLRVAVKTGSFHKRPDGTLHTI